MIKVLIQIMFMPFPWKVRRYMYCKLWGYKIHPTAKIGLSVILAKQLEMDEYSRIHNFIICKRIDLLKMERDSGIATMTYITGFSTDNKSVFSHTANRRCELVMGESSGITSRHFIDCNGGVYVGAFTTVAGIRSQILTHSIDVYKNRQDANPVHIGKYCFIGTGCILLPGSAIPDYSILAGGSVLTKAHNESGCLYAGNPAKKIKNIDINNTLYFHRKQHVVY